MDDGGTRIRHEHPPGDQRRDSAAAERLPPLVEEEGPVGIAVERHTYVETLLAHEIPEIGEILGDEGVGRMIGESAIGLEVETVRAEPLGTVAAMMETGADDVMVLEGDRERLIPFVIDEIVTEVDLDRRRLVVDWSTEY